MICMGSGSSGNSYLIDTDKESLLIDCGVPYKETLRGMKYNVLKLVGVLVSHEHSDHIKFAKEFIKNGVRVYTNQAAADAYKTVSGQQMYGIPELTPFKLGAFRVTSFKIPHDETYNVGFLIEHPSVGKLLYLTDLQYCPYTFARQKVNHIMVECNYCEEDIPEEDRAFSHRVQGHASLEVAKGIIRANMTDALRTVTLIHLSSAASDRKRMLDEVREVVGDGVAVNIATKGFKLKLSEGKNE